MPFAIGAAVWFKKPSQTPFATNTDDSDPQITLDTPGSVGLRDAHGVPTFDFGSLPAALTAQTAVSGTFRPAGELLGVREQTVKNPLAPSTVSTSGDFENPTSAAAFNPGLDAGSPIDEGNVNVGNTNTVSDDDPNVLGGMTVASGYSQPSGTQELVPETIDLTVPARRYGRRLPSSQEAPGIVIAESIASTAGISPDGTAVQPGDRLYTVQWGSQTPSNPHKAKWHNRTRVMVHAEIDLIPAP